jgi:hypothetical protein
MDFTQIAERTSKRSGKSLLPASEDDIRALTDLGTPESLIEFYRTHQPSAMLEIGNVRLWPTADIVIENTDMVPGAYLRVHGFVTFATTIYGDTYCFDTRAPSNGIDAPVVLMSHEVDFEPLDHAAVASLRKRVASGLTDFLFSFVAETLELEPENP